MGGVNLLKLGGGLLGAAALLAMAWLAKDRFHQKGLADAAKACAKAAADPEDSADLKPCLPGVANEIREVRAARLCERALLPSLRPETRFAMSQSCGAGVKRLVAVADSLAAERDGLKDQLATARSETAAAVTRAEARQARQTQRTHNGTKVIQAAPRDPAGRVRCDAECLRRLGA